MAEDLFEKLISGDRRAAARVISLVENDGPGAPEIIRLLHRHTGRAHIVGITGPPGAGKSTLVTAVARELRSREMTVGIVAIDPTSPFSGGALLGDRVRMQELATDKGVFIRSMASRGSLGGVARATNDVINVLDAFGRDVIVVETVGAGQVEVDIVRFAHTSVVVTMPGAGDEIQAIKAGILEIGDVFVVNKADRDESSRTALELSLMLELSPRQPDAWVPPILKTVATTGEGVGQLVDALLEHYRYLREHDLLEAKQRERMISEMVEIISQRVGRAVEGLISDGGPMADLMHSILDTREVDPHTGAALIIEKLKET
jgi:LAO/AO transport system kinase